MPVTKYIWDGDDLLMEKDGDGNTSRIVLPVHGYGLRRLSSALLASCCGRNLTAAVETTTEHTRHSTTATERVLAAESLDMLR